MMNRNTLPFTNPIRALELQKRCDHLLETISPSDSIYNESLKKEYNRIYHKLENLQRDLLADPLVALPPELWVPIIREVAREHLGHISSVDALLLLTLVSEEWCSAILRTSLFWTDIAVGYGEPDAQAKLVTALHLSGTLPLKLQIHFPQEQWDDNLPLVKSCSNRIRTITMKYSYAGGFYPDQHLVLFLSAVGYFPSLRLFDNDGSNTLSFDVVSSRSPELTRIYGSVATLENIESRNGPPLRASTIIYSLTDYVIQNTQLFDQLEELHLVDIRDYENNSQIVTPSPTPPVLTSVHPRRPMSDNKSFLPFLKVTINLTSLTLCIRDKWQHLYDFFGTLKGLSRLVVLDLTVDDIPGNVSSSFMGPISNKTSLRNLSLTYLSPLESLLPKSDVKLRNEDTIISSFAACALEVQKLDISSFAFGFGVASYIGSLTRLWSLNLNQLSLHPGASIESFGLRSLSFESCRQVDIEYLLWGAKCPSLSNLNWDIVFRRNKRYSPIFSTQDGPSVYKNIEYLGIRRTKALWEIPQFRSLKRLALQVSNHAIYEVFILESSNCPKLEEIEFNFIPEWDLLFIMLEGRNYLPKSSGIARINKITIPHPIPPVLTTPLTDILRGRFTKRPSNHELSFSGYMTAYFDPSVLGCRRCFMSMMTCPTAPERSIIARGRVYHRFSARTLDKLPPEPQEWIQDRERRIIDWEAREAEWKTHRLDRSIICSQTLRTPLQFIVAG